MKIKPTYIQVPGSKYTTIQLEMPGRTTIHDINMFMCTSFCENSQPIQNAHIAAYYAYVIQQMRIGLQGLKNKKDIPVQLNYGVFKDLVIVSVSFISDNSFLRLISKMLAEKCFLKNLKPAVGMLYSVFKDLVKEQGREQIEESMRWCQKQVDLVIMSKMDNNKFQGTEDSIGNKAVTLKFTTMIENVQFEKTLPIDQQHIKLDLDNYVKLQNSDMANQSYLTLLLSSLNGQRVPYHCDGTQLYVLKRHLNAQHKEQVIKYMKERLLFTSKKKQKTYSSLTADAKKKTSETEFIKKQKANLYKKETALLQVVLQNASVPHTLIRGLQSAIANLNVDKMSKLFDDLKGDLDTIVKAK